MVVGVSCYFIVEYRDRREKKIAENMKKDLYYVKGLDNIAFHHVEWIIQENEWIINVNNSLTMTIPSEGDLEWSNLIELKMWYTNIKIVEYDIIGIDDKNEFKSVFYYLSAYTN